MFDECHLISQYLKRIRKQTQPFVSAESAYNEALDRRLKRLVFLYRFNFEAVALHLIQEFPQFQYKLSKAGVAYRWYQLVKMSCGQEKNQEVVQQTNQHKSLLAQNLFSQGKTKKEIEKQQSESDQEQIQETCPPKNTRKTSSESPQKLSELEKALAQAQKLAQNQNECFIIYKPNYSTTFSPESVPLIPSPNPNHPQSQDQLSDTDNPQPTKKDQQTEEYEYGYNYSQLEEEYNHYNQIVSSIGYGYHDDSATDGTDSVASQVLDGQSNESADQGANQGIQVGINKEKQADPQDQEEEYQDQQIQFYTLDNFK